MKKTSMKPIILFFLLFFAAIFFKQPVFASNPTVNFTKTNGVALFSNNPEKITNNYANRATYMTNLTPGTYDFHLEHNNQSGTNIRFAVLFWNNGSTTAQITPLQSGTCGTTYSQEVAASRYRNSVEKATVSIPPNQGRWFYYTSTQFVGDQNAIYDMSGHAVSIPHNTVFEGHFKFRTTGGNLRFKSGCYTSTTPTNIQNLSYTGLANATQQDYYTYSGRTQQNAVSANLSFTIPSSATSGTKLPVNLYNSNTGKTVTGAVEWATHLYDYPYYGNELNLAMSDMVSGYIGKDPNDNGTAGQFLITQGSGMTSYLWDTWSPYRTGRAWNWANWFIPTTYNYTFYNASGTGKTVQYWIYNYSNDASSPRNGVVECVSSGNVKYAYIGRNYNHAMVFSCYVGPNSTVSVPATITLLGDSSGGIRNYIKVA